MRTFQVTYRIVGSLVPKTYTKDVDALNSVSAKQQVKRDVTPAIQIIRCEDISGPPELKELMRF